MRLEISEIHGKLWKKEKGKDIMNMSYFFTGKNKIQLSLHLVCQ